MSAERMRAKLQSGEPVFVAWIGIGNSISTEVMGAAGYDGVILDAQHGGVTFDNMVGLIQALDLSGTAALVRVPSTNQAEIMRALDLGAAGVIVPMVSTETQARQAAEAMRYPPNGIRSFGRVRNFYAAQGETAAPLCFVMIETAEAMEHLDAIAAVPGVDGLFVGAIDLALSLGMGVVLQSNETVLASVDKVVAACRRHRKISGCAALGVQHAHALLDRGVQFIAQGSDLNFIRRGAAEELEQLRAWRAKPKGGPR